MNRITKAFTYIEFEESKELPQKDEELVEIAREISQSAHAPYSGIKVGAAVLLEDGTIIKGNNQENAVYPSGLCAERVAVFSASSLYPDTIIESIAISAFSNDHVIYDPVSPCGSCRQVLMEYEQKQKHPIKVILSGQKGKVLLIDCVADLLPLRVF